MGLTDKISNAAEKGLGSAKETAGKLLDKPGLEQEGRTDQAAASAKQAGEKVKDAGKDIKNGFTN
ncbi:MAG: CsbD family protein [Specibacter sp.]